MKLKTRLFITFLCVILIPVILGVISILGAAFVYGQKIRTVYGVDITNLQPSTKGLLVNIIFSMLVILVITALLLSVWLDRSIAAPITALTKATKNIRDGNLDFELKSEGSVTEIRELSESFEEMRLRLKQASEVTEEFNRQNRELISNISHDLRTPITSVRGYCEGIMDGVADTPEKMDRYIRTIYTKTGEMDRLINELSFYSKITTNRIPYDFNKVNVRQFFDDAAEAAHDELQTKGFTFTYTNTVSEDVAMIADVEQLTRVISNIIGNSVKYADKEEKKIGLDVSMLGDEIQVAISDNGQGISGRDLGSIFERFYRTDSSRSSRQGGSGIGLSIVKKIIEDHGGRVWAASKEGEGTTMYFALRQYFDQNKGE